MSVWEDLREFSIFDEAQLRGSAGEIFAGMDYTIRQRLPSEWTQEKRYIDSGSAFLGPYQFERTPYVREMLDCLSPDFVPHMGDVPMTVGAVMKALQIGITEGLVLNGLGWIIEDSPANALLLSAVKDLSKEIVEERLDPMIENSGLRKYIRPAVRKTRNQRTGDTASSKEFSGGRLIIDSIQSMKKARQRSVKYGFFDDFEAVKQADKGAGDVLGVWEGRFASYGSQMKLFLISTPELAETSNIEPAFKLGDQRYFNVPCPKCSGDIDFIWSDTRGGERVGIVYQTDERDRLIASSVGYVCQKCGHFFKDNLKRELMINGKFIPTAEACQPGYYSWHVNALYAPSGMYDWEHYVRKWLKACPEGQPVQRRLLHTFRNTTLGQTWKDDTREVLGSSVSKNSRPYFPMTVPTELSEQDGNGEILFLSMASDLNGKIEDARVDLEVVAHCENMSTYSVVHGSIGSFGLKDKNGQRVPEDKREVLTYDHAKPNSVWPLLHKVIAQEFLDSEGNGHNIAINGIDYGHFTVYAKKFVDQFPQWVYGLKGENPDNFTKVYGEKKTWKKSQNIPKQYNVDVNVYKDEVAQYMAYTWGPNQPQPPGFMNYPESRDGLYTYDGFFKQYSGERRTSQKNETGDETGFLWQKKSSRSQVHMWDCRIYNTTMRDIYMDMVCRMRVKKLPPSWALFVDIMKAEKKN
jgi:phage terminase large subunit GpA-like protein